VSLPYVLGIDPGAASGAGLLDPDGKLVASEQFEERDALRRQDFVKRAVHSAVEAVADLVVVREKWQAGGKFATPRIFAGLGASWGAWREQLFLVVPELPHSRILQVFPSTWKSKLGLGKAWQDPAYEYVRQRFGKGCRSDAPCPTCAGGGDICLGPDEIVGICLAVYGRRLCEVKVRNRPRKAAAVPQWQKRFRLRRGWRDE
jgi:hypothetical protein